MERLKRAIGPYALYKIKTCESHFKECRNRQARKSNEHVDEIVKTCDALLEVVSPVAYERARENLENRRTRREHIFRTGSTCGRKDGVTSFVLSHRLKEHRK